MSLSHRELLQQAEDLYQAELNKVAQQETQLETANARILALEAEIEDLTKPPEPIPVYLWKDEFTDPPDDERYIRACVDPVKNFVLASPGILRVIFVAGTVGGEHANGPANEVLRTELIRRNAAGQQERDPIGSERIYEVGFTIPTDWKPFKPNDKVLCSQHWQVQEVSPPIQFQILDPETTPDPLILRLVRSSPLGSEMRIWKMPVEKGKRYDLEYGVRWSAGADGKITLKVNGVDRTAEIQDGGKGATCYAKSQGMAQHIGAYWPGSASYPVGHTTELVFHHWRVRQP